MTPRASPCLKVKLTARNAQNSSEPGHIRDQALRAHPPGSARAAVRGSQYRFDRCDTSSATICSDDVRDGDVGVLERHVREWKGETGDGGGDRQRRHVERCAKHAVA